MARILLVGTATLDLVFTLDRYPAEDEEVRAQGLRLCRGGNAANSAVVLAQLGHHCSFVGVLADAPESAVIEQDFARYGVDFAGCPRLPGRPPTSSIQLTAASRTIVHYRDLPELTAAQFAEINLAPFDWIHFEGRNVPELLQMLARVRSLRPELAVSLELEKPRAGIEAALGQASLLICSRSYAQHCGHTAPRDFLTRLQRLAPQAESVAAWGAAGAFGRSRQGEDSHSPAFPPARVVDTLGAGDTFNAGLIAALAAGAPLSRALEQGCRLAGGKCGVAGFALNPSSAAASGRVETN